MKRSKIAQKVNIEAERFLKQNPEIAKALKVFDVSYEQYRTATEQVRIHTESSTNPKSVVHQYK